MHTLLYMTITYNNSILVKDDGSYTLTDPEYDNTNCITDNELTGFDAQKFGC